MDIKIIIGIVVVVICCSSKLSSDSTGCGTGAYVKYFIN